MILVLNKCIRFNAGGGLSKWLLLQFKSPRMFVMFTRKKFYLQLIYYDTRYTIYILCEINQNKILNQMYCWIYKIMYILNLCVILIILFNFFVIETILNSFSLFKLIYQNGYMFIVLFVVFVLMYYCSYYYNINRISFF